MLMCYVNFKTQVCIVNIQQNGSLASISPSLFRTTVVWRVYIFNSCFLILPCNYLLQKVKNANIGCSIWQKLVS